MKIIQKDKTHFILESYLDININIEILFNSIIQTNLLSFPFIDNQLNNKKQLHFHAESVESLKEFIDKNNNNNNNNNNNFDINLAILLFFSLGKQIYCLEQMNYTLTGFGHDFNDIIVINQCYFFYINTLYLIPFRNEDKNDLIYFFYPFDKPYFSSPELLNISTLPAVISKKSIYYSLGCLIIYLLFDVFILKGNDFASDIEIKNILKSIYGTKIYWALLRCLKYNKDVDLDVDVDVDVDKQVDRLLIYF